MIPRSWLFISGDNARLLAKAAGSAADAVILDLEDGVVAARKKLARALVVEHLCEPRSGPQRWVRINALDTPHAEHDLAQIMKAGPHGIVLPKAESGALVTRMVTALNRCERELGLPNGSTALFPIAFETPRALLELPSYRDLDQRVVALSWGAEDMAAAIGAASNRDADGSYTMPYQLARSYCLIAATGGRAGARVEPVETAYLNYKDTEGLALYCAAARRDGFTGMFAIHPAQVDVINAAFTPSAEEIDHARAVVQAFEDSPESGTVGLNGTMLDRPHLAQAQRILGLARQIGESP